MSDKPPSLQSEADRIIDADDTARLDAHAEHAALEYGFEPANRNSPEYDTWLNSVAGPGGDCDLVGKVVCIKVHDDELAVHLDGAGWAHIQFHLAVRDDRLGERSVPYIPNPTIEERRALLEQPPTHFIRLDMGEPVITGKASYARDLAAALTKAAAIMERYESDWKRHYDAFKGRQPT